MTVGDYWRLARPGNALMAAFGVVVGGVLAADSDAHWGSLSFAALAAVFGVAGGNAFNDVRDRDIDRRAHPTRPVARGALSNSQAMTFAMTCIVAALVIAGFAGLLAPFFAALLVLGLVLYEMVLKERGLLGNILVSLVVGGTFFLGALAVAPGMDVIGVVLAYSAPGWRAVELVATLAVLANVAREIFKDIEDLEPDRANRRTFPMWVGPTKAMWVARSLLVLGVIAIPVLPLLGEGVVSVVYLVLVPSILLFGVAITRAKAAAAQRWTKVAMVTALAAFLVIGII